PLLEAAYAPESFAKSLRVVVKVWRTSLYRNTLPLSMTPKMLCALGDGVSQTLYGHPAQLAKIPSEGSVLPRPLSAPSTKPRSMRVSRAVVSDAKHALTPTRDAARI